MNGDEPGYRPIRDYAIIGDGHTAALVARDGSIDWCCWPHFDSPAVFCRVLDARRGGWFSVRPVGPYQASRQYAGETNVLVTTFSTETGEVRLTDFMPAEQRSASGRGEDIEASHQLMRCVEGIAGKVELELAFRPTFDYARAETTCEVSEEGAVATGAGHVLHLRSRIPLEIDPAGAATSQFIVKRGSRVWFVLADGAGQDRADPEAALARTLRYWERWSALCTYAGPYHGLVRRSALALKLLTFEPTGALVAAPTTSLPETIGGTRNWDYRFTWLRDSSLILYALQSIGYHEEAMDFFDWLSSLCLACQDSIQIMYTLAGGRELPEQILPHLEGYRGSRPVRIGNGAARQTQLDIYGEVLDAAHLCYERMQKMPDPELSFVLALLADRAAAVWQAPDQGIWEVRTGPRHFLYSKLLCWVAVDRAISLAQRGVIKGNVQIWRRARRDIRQAILTEGYSERLQAFTQACDAPVLDASALVIPLVGFLPPTDPRVRSTVRQIREHLTSNGLVYRYLTKDGLSGGEGTFALCSFWLVDNLALAGDVGAARELFERIVAYANDVGLLSEEIEPSSGDLLGNFPQGFTHLALIRSALNITTAEARGPETRATRPAERQEAIPVEAAAPVTAARKARMN